MTISESCGTLEWSRDRVRISHNFEQAVPFPASIQFAHWMDAIERRLIQEQNALYAVCLSTKQSVDPRRRLGLLETNEWNLLYVAIATAQPMLRHEHVLSWLCA